MKSIEIILFLLMKAFFCDLRKDLVKSTLTSEACTELLQRWKTLQHLLNAYKPLIMVAASHPWIRLHKL